MKGTDADRNIGNTSADLIVVVVGIPNDVMMFVGLCMAVDELNDGSMILITINYVFRMHCMNNYKNTRYRLRAHKWVLMGRYCVTQMGCYCVT